MRRFIIIIAILAGIVAVSGWTAPKEKKVNLRVMSFNVLYGSDNDTSAAYRSNPELKVRCAHPWPARKEAFKEMFAAYYPDVAGFNEPMPNQQIWIRKKLNKRYDYYSIPDTTCTNRGLSAHATGNNMVAWRRDRLERLDSGYFWLSDTPDVPSKYGGASYSSYTSAVWCRFLDKKCGRTFVFCATHTMAGPKDSDNEIRIKQAKIISERMQAVALPDETVFVCGDLNASNTVKNPKSNNCDYRLSLVPYYEWMVNARETSPKEIGGPSWNAFGKWGALRPNFNLDHIFYRSSTVVPFKFVTVSEQWGDLDYISDHYPIVFDCKW